MNVLRGWLFDNLGLKLTALLLAVLVYLNVYTDRTGTMLLSFPLEFSGLADSLSLSGPAPAVVQAELRGTVKQLIGLRVREPRLKIPMDGVAPGHFTRALVSTDLPLPAGGVITVENVVGPRVIEVDVDRRETREFPVAARVEGSPAAGWSWDGTALLLPDRVRVSGPASALEALDSLQLTTLRIDGRHDTLRTVATLARLPDWCSADPSTVRLRIGFRRR